MVVNQGTGWQELVGKDIERSRRDG